MPSATLAFLIAERAALETICTRCSWPKEYDPARLAEVAGSDQVTIDELEARLKPCRRCGGSLRFETVAKRLPPPAGMPA